MIASRETSFRFFLYCFQADRPLMPSSSWRGNNSRSLVDHCLREFDATIIDTPPANDYSDARRVSQVVGYSLLVARQNKSLIDDLKSLKEQLQGDKAKVIGCVLNMT